MREGASVLGKLDTRLVLELVRSSQWAGEAVTAEGVGAPEGGGGGLRAAERDR